MKKILASIMALVMLFSFAACGADQDKGTTPNAGNENPGNGTAENAASETRKWEGKKLTVNFAVSTSEAAQLEWFDSVKSSFEDATGATVELRIYAAADLNVKQKADLIGGISSDIIYVTGSSILEYYDSGFLLPLDNMFDEETTSDWPFYDYVSIDGGHYVVPHTGGMAYRIVAMNVDLCKQLGLEVPAQDELTWDLMVEYAQKAVDAGYKGYMAPFSGNENTLIHNWYSFVHQAGGTYITEDMAFDFSDPACLEAFQFVYDMFNTYKIIDTVANDANTTLDQFVAGETLFATMNMSGFNTRYNSGAMTFEAAAYNLRNERCGTFNTVDSMAIASTCAEPELAAEFIKWAMSAEIYQSYREAVATTAACVTSVHAEEQICEPIQHIAADTDCIYFPPFMDPNGTEIIEQLNIQQQLVALGEVTPEQAVATMQALVESLK